jgi:hypothetical protein
MKNHYRAYIQNESGAQSFGSVAEGTNLNELKRKMRQMYGKGWIITIDRIDDCGDGWMENVEVARFKIR